MCFVAKIEEKAEKMAVFSSGFVCRNRIVTACILYYNQPKSKNVCHIHAANYKAEGLILSQMKIKVLLADDNKDFCDVDIAIATEHLVLAAAEQGLFAEAGRYAGGSRCHGRHRRHEQDSGIPSRCGSH